LILALLTFRQYNYDELYELLETSQVQLSVLLDEFFYSASEQLAMQSAVQAIVNPSVHLSVCLSVTRWHCVNMTHATIMGSSLQDSPMTLVS